MTARLVTVLPVHTGDFHLAMQWLRWVKRLREQPDQVKAVVEDVRWAADPQVDFPIAILHAKSLPLPAVDDLKKMAADIPWTTVHSQPELYERPEHGYAAAANMMFRNALELVEREWPGVPMLWCEPDAIPMRPDWLYEIEEEYRQNEAPFMGDFHPAEISHMTGNAVYPPNWRELAPSLARLPEPKIEQGWDSKCAHETVPQSHRACTIQQIWEPPSPMRAHDLHRIHPDTALFHRCKDGSLINLLAARLGQPEIPLEAPLIRVGPRLGSAERPTGPRIEILIEILIVTHAKDEGFMRYCMRSVSMFCAGFSGVTVVVPRSEEKMFSWLPRKTRVITHEDIPGKGMLMHLIMKSRADELCPDADMILHVDSDCLFWEPTAPDDYLPGGRPLLVTEEYEHLLNPNRRNWRDTVIAATGLHPLYETMVRHPQIHHRAVYKRMRELVEKKHGVGFNDYVLAGRNQFPQTFCEFNTLGAVALAEFPSLYAVRPYDRRSDAQQCGQDYHGSWQYIYRKGRDKLIEGWSHGGIDQYAALFNNCLVGKRPEFFVK